MHQSGDVTTEVRIALCVEPSAGRRVRRLEIEMAYIDRAPWIYDVFCNVGPGARRGPGHSSSDIFHADVGGHVLHPDQVVDARVPDLRSEERRVGKECRSRCARCE